MPQRTISDTCCTSENLALASAEAERLFWRLISRADDYGRFHADPRLVRSACFPLKTDDFSLDMVAAWLDELARPDVMLIERYQVDGRWYLQLPAWFKIQRKRDSKPKFPALSTASLPLFAATRGDSPQSAASRARRTPDTDPESDTGERARATPPTSSDPAIFTLEAWTHEQPAPLRAALAEADRRYPAVEFAVRPFLAIHAHFRGGPCGVEPMRHALDRLRNHDHTLAVILGAWVGYCDPATNPDNPLYVNPQKFVQTFNAWLPGAPRVGTSAPVATEGDRAWGFVLECVRKVGRARGFPADTLFGVPLKTVVDRIGWSRICDSSNLAIERPNFLRLYANETAGTTPAPAGRAPARSTIRGAAAILVPLLATLALAGGGV